MYRLVPRLLLLVLLFLAGGYALLYGLVYHRVALDETKQRTVMVAVNTFGDPGEPPPDAGGDAQGVPPETPPPESGHPSDDVDPFRSPPAGNEPAANSENPFETPASPAGLPNIPGVRLKKTTEDYTDVTFVSEWAIVRDVTVGGVMRLPNGHLKRTYSGKPPALCPT
jgi:hypothetical protein